MANIIRVVAQPTPSDLADGDTLRYSSSDLAFVNSVRESFNVRDYGAVGDGAADDTAAIQAAINAAGAAGGGIVYHPTGVYRINGQLTFPDDAQTYPQQPYIRLCGEGGGQNGRGFAPFGGSRLDLRYNGAGTAKIYTRGSGILEIDHLTLMDDGGDAKPFVMTTNTVLHVHHCEFHGDPTKSTTDCDQDCIILGGTGTNGGQGDNNAPFQGYGTVIESNYFNHIRRAVYGRVFANGNVIQSNCIWNGCGSNLAGGACIEFVGGGAQVDAGNVIQNNLIEIGGYPYGVKLTTAEENSIVFNNFFDDSATNLGYIRFESDAEYNLVMLGFGSDARTNVSDATSTQSNTVINAHQSQYSYIAQFLTLQPGGTRVYRAGVTAPDGIVLQDSAGNQWWWRIQAGNVYVMTHPAGGSDAEVAYWKAASATDKRLHLQGTTDNYVYAENAQMRIYCKVGEALWLGDPTNNIYVLNGTPYLGSAWNGKMLRLGVYRIWVDSSGRLRIKNDDPTGDTDGTVVGDQAA